MSGVLYASNFRVSVTDSSPSQQLPSPPSSDVSLCQPTGPPPMLQHGYAASSAPFNPSNGVDCAGDEGRLVGWEMDPGLISLAGDDPSQSLAMSYRAIRLRGGHELSLCTCLAYRLIELLSADVMAIPGDPRGIRHCAIAGGWARVEIEGEHRAILKSDDVFTVPAGKSFTVQNSMYDPIHIYMYMRVALAGFGPQVQPAARQPQDPPLQYTGFRPSHATMLTSRFFCKHETCGYCHCIRFDIILLEPGGMASFPPDSKAVRYCNVPEGKLHVDVAGQKAFLIGKHGLFIVQQGAGFSTQSVVQVRSKLYVVTLLPRTSPAPAPAPAPAPVG